MGLMSENTYEVMQRLADASKRAKFIERAPASAGGGDYIAHDVINQLALAMVGPHSFEVIELIRGHIPAWVDKEGKLRRDARIDGVTGVLARLTVDIGGKTYTIVEVGDEGNPQLGSDAENTKKAASDAYKRCWMRLGLGLELWAQENWALPAMLAHYHQQVEGQGSLL